MSKTETIEAMIDQYNDHNPEEMPEGYDWQHEAMKAAYAVAREAVLDEVKAELAKHAVKIEGTPYSCGPRKWMQFIHAMKGPDA